jgi:hypothetical protein
MSASGKAIRSYAGILLIASGLGIAAGGARVLSRVANTADLVATGNDVRNGASDLSHAELLATADRLDASATARTADETGAMTFLYFAAAQASLRAGDLTTATAEMATARRMAIETLKMAPTRADVSLTLAWIELAMGKERPAIDAPLLLSYETAPRELWIIERRIWLGLRLASTATPQLMSHIVNDIRTMGAPFRSSDLYMELAQSARAAGLYAITLVRHELGAIHDQPLQAFNTYLARLDAQAAPKKP